MRIGRVVLRLPHHIPSCDHKGTSRIHPTSPLFPTNGKGVAKGAKKNDPPFNAF